MRDTDMRGSRPKCRWHIVYVRSESGLQVRSRHRTARATVAAVIRCQRQGLDTYLATTTQRREHPKQQSAFDLPDGMVKVSASAAWAAYVQ